MDSAEGADPSAATGGDWRSHLQPEDRSRIVNKIVEILKKHLPVIGPDCLRELQKIAMRFEKKIYDAATSQSDYLRKICLKMLSMERQSQTSTQQNPENAQVVQNQMSHSLDSAVCFSGLSKNGTGRIESDLFQLPSVGIGADFSIAAAIADDGSWHSHLHPEGHTMIMNRIMEPLKEHLLVPAPGAQGELGVVQQTTVRFEENMHTSDPNRTDYLESITRKILPMESETKIKQNPGNAQVAPNQRLPVPASEDSTAQTDCPGAGDWQEELYQKIKTLKDLYLPELSDLYNKISVKLEHIDNHMAAQKLTVDYEKMKSFKAMLEHTMLFLQTDKNCVQFQLSLMDKIPLYERQIVGIINSQKRKPVHTFDKSAGETPSSNTSSIPLDSTAQPGYPVEGNWQEELYQMIKALKDRYLPELSNLYNKLSLKLEHINNHMPAQKLTEQYEKMKNFKLMLERTLQFLQIDKSCGQLKLALKDKIPLYERQIISIINAQKRKSVQTFEQSAGQIPSANTSSIPVDSAVQTAYPPRVREKTGYLGAVDLHELSQMNETLKNQYLAGLSDLYEMSMKLHAESHMAPQKRADQYEEGKSFKSMLERSLHSLQIGKSGVQPDIGGSIPMYKRQIMDILNSEGWKHEQAFQQSGRQAPNTSSSREPGMPSAPCNRKRSRPV